MTSKEALEELVLYLNANEPKGLYLENIKKIKKDLELLEILKNKKVDVEWLETTKTLKGYNNNLLVDRLTEEEFRILKWWLEK